MYELFAKDLCERVKALNDDTIIEVKFLELYQGKIRDLLTDDKIECDIRENSDGVFELRAPVSKDDEGKYIAKGVTGTYSIYSFNIESYTRIY